MEHLRIEAYVAQLNGEQFARVARENMEVNPLGAHYMQERAAEYYRRARVALGIES